MSIVHKLYIVHLSFVHLFNCLISRNNYHLHNVLYFATAAQVIHRSGDTLQNRTYSVRTAEALNQLVSDVSGLQIREHEYVRFACYLAVRCFGLCYALDQRCICL